MGHLSLASRALDYHESTAKVQQCSCFLGYDEDNVAFLAAQGVSFLSNRCLTDRFNPHPTNILHDVTIKLLLFLPPLFGGYEKATSCVIFAGPAPERRREIKDLFQCSSLSGRNNTRRNLSST